MFSHKAVPFNDVMINILPLVSPVNGGPDPGLVILRERQVLRRPPLDQLSCDANCFRKYRWPSKGKPVVTAQLVTTVLLIDRNQAQRERWAKDRTERFGFHFAPAKC